MTREASHAERPATNRARATQWDKHVDTKTMLCISTPPMPWIRLLAHPVGPADRGLYTTSTGSRLSSSNPYRQDALFGIWFGSRVPHIMQTDVITASLHFCPTNDHARIIFFGSRSFLFFFSIPFLKEILAEDQDVA